MTDELSLLEMSRLILEARGFAELEMHEDAWEVLGSLPPERRVIPPALAVRLMVGAGLKRWEMGSAGIPGDSAHFSARKCVPPVQALTTSVTSQPTASMAEVVMFIFEEQEDEAGHAGLVQQHWAGPLSASLKNDIGFPLHRLLGSSSHSPDIRASRRRELLYQAAVSSRA